MDLIYTDANKNDIGVLLDYNLDLAFGYDENNFECTIVAESHCCEPGSYLYMDGTEYGGIVDSIESNSSTNEVVYHGRSWHGILNSKVIEPDAGQAYLILSGEANTVIRSLITRLNLGSLFEGSTEASGLTFGNYKVPRYIEAYEGISKALNKIGGKLIVNFHNGKVHLSAVPKVDYSQSGEFDQAQTPMKVRKDYNTVNHLILLGQGELQNRLVMHLYADTEGNISTTQTQTGLNEYTAIYELSNVESASELIQQGTDHFQDLISTGDIEIDLDSDNDAFDVGDSFGSYDNITGIYVSEQITKKIISIRNGLISVDFKTEKTTSTSAASSGSSGGGGSGGETLLLVTVSVDGTNLILGQNVNAGRLWKAEASGSTLVFTEVI